MSEHLPECPVTPAEVAARNMDGHPRALCICDRLRACEHRVKRVERAFSHLKGATYGHEQGWNEALDAAREAVDRLASDMANWSSAETAAATEAAPDLTVDQWMWAQRGVHRALAAIDAMRGMQ